MYIGKTLQVKGFHEKIKRAFLEGLRVYIRLKMHILWKFLHKVLYDDGPSTATFANVLSIFKYPQNFPPNTTKPPKEPPLPYAYSIVIMRRRLPIKHKTHPSEHKHNLPSCHCFGIKP